MKTKVLISIIAIILVVNIIFVVAHGNFNETKELIDSNISCDKLTDEQLEEIGDYFMEQMHPGEAHEQMHNMMGGEDSETVKQMHINMAKMMYCNEGEGMNNMMSMMSGGMMNGMMQGMMGSKEYTYWNFVDILYVTLLIILIILACLVIIKLSIGLKTKRR